MSNPARAPVEYTNAQLALGEGLPAFYFKDLPAIVNKADRFVDIEEAKRVLQPLDLEPAVSFFVPPNLTIDKNIQNATKPFLARADKSKLVGRKRTATGQGAMAAAYRALPEAGPFSKEVVFPVVNSKVSLDGGTQYTMGRLGMAVPKRGAPAPSEPVTRAEAQAAIDNCGIRMQGRMKEALYPYPLLSRPGDALAIKVNPKSSNGFPVLGKWNTEGAAAKVMGLAVTIEQEVNRAFRAGERQGVESWLRDKELSAPHLVTLLGKTKADCYTEEKAEALRLRFYNVFPRQVLLNMQKATQVLEGNATHLLNSDANSAIGISLAHGGAEELVAELERRCEAQGYAYTHVGDDSWVIARLASGRHVMFALDCSNFDLTQHSKVTEEVHEAMYHELKLVDGPAAALWHSYARQRNVVTTGTLNLTWKHCGPSGMPLQSKVNDMLMEVLLMRTVSRMPDDCDEQGLERLLAEVGLGMGFSIRLEQYVSGDSVRGILQRTPFLYIGYYFWADSEEQVQCFADVSRTLSQVPYPSVRWMEKEAVQPLEAVRIASIYLNLGIPPPELEAAFAAYRQFAIETLEAAKHSHLRLDEETLRWALKETPWGPTLIPSLEGLRAAVQKDPGELWLWREPALPAHSQFIENWADQVEEEEQVAANREGSRLERPAGMSVAPTYVPRRPAPTHPPTWRNVGRPPPTAVWGPDRAPRERDQQGPMNPTGSTRIRRNGYIAFENWSSGDESGYDDDRGYETDWSE